MRVGFLLLFMMSSACVRAPEALMLSGPTMGTTYTVRWLATRDTPDSSVLRRAIEMELAQVDEQMSRYRPDSELSRFNAARSTDAQKVSLELAQLLSESLALHSASKGAFDVTVAPLIDAWGFGPQPGASRAPDARWVAHLLERRGGHLLEVTKAPPAIRKLRADLEIDLNAIAPGHAVDRICALLEKRGVSSYLVDVGGEIRVRGHNALGGPWRIAIDDPRHEEQVPYTTIELSQGAVATSGGYRHFRMIDGQRYSHILDPRTGYPAMGTTAAVVVIAPTATQADGWATALFVLGEKKGLALATERELAALFLVLDGEQLHEYASPAFMRYRKHVGASPQNAS
jgi:thiamine biosynthesis lipoprotein